MFLDSAAAWQPSELDICNIAAAWQHSELDILDSTAAWQPSELGSLQILTFGLISKPKPPQTTK